MQLKKRRGALLASVLVLVALAIVLASCKSILQEWHIARLRSEDQATRHAAAFSLAALKCYRAIPRLLELHGRGDPDLDSLLLYLAQPPAVPYFEEALRHPDPSVAQFAGASLAHIGEAARPALPAIVKALEDPRPTVKLGAVYALRALEPRHPGMPRALLECLSDSDRHTTLVAKHLLAEMGEEVVPFLAESLADSREATRILAADALGRIARKARLSPAAPAIRDALRPVLRDPSMLVRAQAAYGILLLDGDDREAVSVFAGALREAPAEIREMVAGFLWSLRPVSEGLLPTLFSSLKDSIPEVREAAATAIQEMNLSVLPSTKELLAALRDPEDTIRMAAFSTLLKAGVDPLPAVLEGARDPQVQVREVAVDLIAWALDIEPPLEQGIRERLFAALKERREDADPELHKTAGRILKNWKR